MKNTEIEVKKFKRQAFIFKRVFLRLIFSPDGFTQLSHCFRKSPEEQKGPEFSYSLLRLRHRRKHRHQHEEDNQNTSKDGKVRRKKTANIPAGNICFFADYIS